MDIAFVKLGSFLDNDNPAFIYFIGVFKYFFFSHGFNEEFNFAYLMKFWMDNPCFV